MAKTKAKPKTTRTKTTRLYVHVVLDRSGSMAGRAADAVGGYNEYVRGLPATARVSLTVFDTGSVDMIRDAAIPAAAIIGAQEFQPRGGTPLFDAVGKTLLEAERRSAGFDRVALVILTDGEENSSIEFTAPQIAARLADKQERDGWLVLYLGANQDAWKAAAAIGIGQRYSMPYTNNNMGGTITAMAINTVSYASAESSSIGRAASVITNAQRASAVKK